MFRRFIKGLLLIIAIAAVLLAGAGLYIGNTAYEHFRTAAWDQVLGIENRTHNLRPIERAQARNDWEPVQVTAADGTVLKGTYIEDARRSHHTVILLHGLYQNRSMCLPYVSLYRNLGYNVLLIDQRGHGESGGGHTDWGLSEVDDIDAWVKLLQKKDPAAKIGLHGISLGAAMSLLYAGSSYGDKLAFCVADSSYGNILQLGREKIFDWAQDPLAIWGLDVLDPFFQAAMFYHTHKLLADIEPMQAMKHISVPLLILHGSADELVPVKTADDLYRQDRGKNKYIHIFKGSPHAAGIETHREEYERVLDSFLE